MNSRRDFLKQASLLTAGFTLPSFPFAQAASKYKLGLQLYTIREAIEKDVRTALKGIASYGYQDVETYGFNYGKNKNYWGMHPRDAKQLLDDCKLTTSAGHYDLDKFNAKGQEDALKRYVDQCIEGANTLKQSYIVWPWLAPEYRNPNEFKRLADTLNTIGEQIRKGGLQLAYHNHDFEFADHSGTNGYEILINETDPDLVKLEMDLYWVLYRSPLKPIEWFKKQPGRFVIWHIKDMDKQDRDLHTTVGDGQIDFKSILKDTQISGVKHMFVEQGNNYVPDAMRCVQRSAKYVRGNLLK